MQSALSWRLCARWSHRAAIERAVGRLSWRPRRWPSGQPTAAATNAISLACVFVCERVCVCACVSGLPALELLGNLLSVWCMLSSKRKLWASCTQQDKVGQAEAEVDKAVLRFVVVKPESSSIYALLHGHGHALTNASPVNL